MEVVGELQGEVEKFFQVNGNTQLNLEHESLNVCQGLKSHYFHIIGDGKLNPSP